VPGSGKTSLAIALQALAEAAGTRCTHVQFDSYINHAALQGDFDPAQWKVGPAA
jgi:chloramphenicol 3-O-phosphotransferase